MVGKYAVQFLWSDAHFTGIYTFETLRRLCDCAECRAARVTERLPRAILFDLDDTIISASASTPNAMEQVCAQFAPRGSRRLRRRAVLRFPGRRDGVLVRAGEAAPGSAESRRGNARHRGERAGQRGRVRRVGARERARRELPRRRARGASRCIRAPSRRWRSCAAEGVRLALITNGSAEGQRGKVVRFGLERYFGCIVIEGEFGVGKPDERVYRHALTELDTEPSDAWMVGRQPGVGGGDAAAAGVLRGVWVDWAGVGHCRRDPQLTSVRPDRIVRRSNSHPCCEFLYKLAVSQRGCPPSP